MLHCGTTNVLQHYEDFFGRPTGVNFPFWTDHEAFPYVWGREAPESDVLFLGNVHDAVRRRRYFAIGQMQADVRIHGNTGTDYLGLGGGYLDTDAEVVSAGAAARIALNIPQFFEDHRGLPTWFPGLDKLGFFEYPSRVIQYIAMGLPVVSIVPGVKRFESLPEMVVVDDLAAADEAIASILTGDLQAQSGAAEARFSRHFSANARAMAFETILEDDSWRRLDAHDRNMWFTQFDGSAAPTPTPAPRASISLAPASEHVLLIGTDFGSVTSRAAVTLRALRAMGYSTQAVDPTEATIAESAAPDGVIVCGAALADKVPACVEDPWRVLIHDTARAPRDVSAPLTQFDAIGVRDATLAAKLVDAGHHNILFCPPAVDAEFRAACTNVAPALIVKTHTSPLADQVFAAAYAGDVTDSRMRVQTLESLRGLSLSEMAAALRCRVGLIGLSGSRTAPVIDELVPFAATAADVVVMPRIAPAHLIAPYADVAVQVREPGELALKLRRLGASATALAQASETDKSALHSETVLEKLIAAAKRPAVPKGAPGSYPTGLPYVRMTTRPIVVEQPEGTATRRRIDVSVTGLGEAHRHLLRVRHGGALLLETMATPTASIAVLAPPGESLGPIEVDLVYVGPPSISPTSELGLLTCHAKALANAPGAGGQITRTRAWLLSE